ncbi:MAG: hypothetical protein OXR73_05820, partial [Myxococcales bacterium]|nr:hypothetical protein [Myxococcales bacterium]
AKPITCTSITCLGDGCGLARIIHDFDAASLVVRLHRTFAALENTGSIPVGRRKPCEAEPLRDPTPKS